MRPPLLFGDLPREVRIGEGRVAINWGFRAMILVEMCMYDDQLDDSSKLLHALNIFFCGSIPADMDAAIEALLWFHRVGEKEDAPEQKRTGAPMRKQKRAYDFSQDSGHIFAAFLSQYGLNLARIRNEDLHWWEFKAMFESLGEEQKISRIMYYRTADTNGMSKSQVKFINRMRQLYAIKGPAQDMDAHTKLIQRNNRMRDYIRKRYEDAARKETQNKVPLLRV